MLAHELGQPLAAIVAYARGCLMRTKADSLTRPELEDALERIVNAALRAGAILQDARAPKEPL
jgi:signal transduction histidine kinase